MTAAAAAAAAFVPCAAALTGADWLQLFLYQLSLSLLAVGGALGTMPEMHRFLVERQGWLSELQFGASIAIAQAAPGPNVLFIALLGWNVGLNAGGAGARGWLLGALGMALCMLGALLPSCLLTWCATRWGQRNRQRRALRAFRQGLVPVVTGLLLASAWVLAGAQGHGASDRAPWLLSAAAALLVWRTRLHLLWLLGAGALLGAFGLV